MGEMASRPSLVGWEMELEHARDNRLLMSGEETYIGSTFVDEKHNEQWTLDMEECRLQRAGMHSTSDPLTRTISVVLSANLSPHGTWIFSSRRYRGNGFRPLASTGLASEHMKNSVGTYCLCTRWQFRRKRSRGRPPNHVQSMRPVHRK